MHFIGFALGEYRSFGLGLQRVRARGPVTVVAGPNNIGKSNALAVLHLAMPHFRVNGQIDPSNVWKSTEDTPRHSSGEGRRFAVGIDLDEGDIQRMRLDTAPELLSALRSEHFDLDGDGGTWFEFRIIESNNGHYVKADQDQIQRAIPNESSVQGLSMSFTGTSGGGAGDDWQRVVHAWGVLNTIPSVQYLGAMRRVLNDTSVEAGSTHLDRPQLDALINQLADHQSPSDPARRTAMKAKFAELQKFLREVLGDTTAAFEVPNDRSTIFVTSSNGEMQLARLGTGIEEVILLAAAATFPTDAIVCIEEPELHLHPSLQRQLIAYLHQQEQNRFVLSTHSAHILNAPQVSIMRASMEAGNTVLELVASEGARAALTFELGARPSDVVQANFVVWVEGPSDRLYLRAWICALAPDLIEGVHYSIVFYGGRLLSQVSFDDQEVDDLVQLQRMARKYAVVLDSDKRKASDTVNATKDRVVSEAQASGAFAWVTAGREIENYVSRERLESALAVAYPEKSYSTAFGKWDSILSSSFDGMSTKPSKVTIARELTATEWSPDDWKYDLADRVRELVEHIRAAN